MEIVLETKKLRKEYGTKGMTFTALDGIDLKVYKGEFLGIMGPSGAGKTTLLNVLSTIDKPTSGDVLAFRIKDNFRTFAAIAVLITTCITSFGTVRSLRYFVDENHKIEVPYTVTYISNKQEVIEKVEEIIKDLDYKIELSEKANFLFDPESEVIAVKLSTFQKKLSDLNVKDREGIMSKISQLKDEAVYIEKPGVLMNLIEIKETKVGDRIYKIKSQLKVPLFGNGVPYPCAVVSDEEYDVLKLKLEEKQFNGIILDNPENTEDLTYRLAEILPPEARLYTYFIAGTTLYDLVGIVYFLGAFLFLVFVFATGSIIYFKILSESFKDKGKYEMLRKIGTTDIEIRESVSKQVGLFFMMPLVVGVIHSIVAILVLSDLMKYSLIIPTVMSIIVFSIVYFIFYIFTRRKYISVVEG